MPRKLLLTALGLVAAYAQPDAPASQRRIIDVHLHAFATVPGLVDQSAGVRELELTAPATDMALREQTIAALRENNVVRAVVSGTSQRVDAWVAAAPDREEVLTEHPRLKIYVENAGYPFAAEMLALLFQYPERLYVDMSTVIRIVPRKEFYRYPKLFVDAGYSHRIMFGSDQVYWPGAIGAAIGIMEDAPFLTEEQKEDIFYRNAGASSAGRTS